MCFLLVYSLFTVTEYIAKNIGFLCLILATGCYSSETNAIVHLQYVKHFSVSLSICAMFCKKPQSMFEINELIFFVRYMYILYFRPILLTVFLAGRIQIDS